MEQKSDSVLKDATSAPFNLYKFITPTTIHVAVEVILASVFFAYFTRKINKNKAEFTERIEALEEQIAALDALVKDLALQAGSQKDNLRDNLRDTSKEAHVKKERTPKPPQMKSVTPTNLAMNFFQEFMQNSAPEQKTHLPTIVEVTEPPQEAEKVEPVSREQLDRELSDELGELRT